MSYSYCDCAKPKLMLSPSGVMICSTCGDPIRETRNFMRLMCLGGHNWTGVAVSCCPQCGRRASTDAPKVPSMPTDYNARKALPLVTGCLDYFPDALLAVADCSMKANEQHNPGEPLHWAREKSTDEVNTLARHLLQRGTRDSDGIRHSAKVAWRALAMLQKEIEAEYSTLPNPEPQYGVRNVR